MLGRPERVLTGDLGAVAAAHPLAVGAAVALLDRGGGAVDAAIAAQAVLAVVIPDACGLGGDGLALVAEPSGRVTAVHGAGRSPAAGVLSNDGGASVTVPGVAGAWAELSARWGRVPLADALAPAAGLARRGVVVGDQLAQAVVAQRARLVHGGAGDWVIARAGAGDRVVQSALAEVLEAIGRDGPGAFYRGEVAAAVARAAQADGGALAPADLAAHRTLVGDPVAVDWDGGTAYVQPPPSQGVLLARALRWLEREGPVAVADLDHVLAEVTEAVFGLRDRAGDGAALLAEELAVDRERAARRGGPRAYLHTAGVAAADADGLVVSSLVSVFDDFGSAVFVPEGGFVLNNRAGGFTAGANAPRAGAHPVHTLAPAVVRRGGDVLALATPGADGQVQTLLQVLAGLRWRGRTVPQAIDAPRWRSEGGRLFVEAAHPGAAAMAARGHDVVTLPDGDDRVGGVVAAGWSAGTPFTAGDWRRTVAAGVR